MNNFIFSTTYSNTSILIMLSFVCCFHSHYQVFDGFSSANISEAFFCSSSLSFCESCCKVSLFCLLLPIVDFALSQSALLQSFTSSTLPQEVLSLPTPPSP